MNSRVPDFIIGGAPRSGTSWLYRLLDRHPEISMAKPVKPEPKFFLVDEIYRRGPRFYLDTWFRDIPTGNKTGEKSTNYLESAVAAERISRTLPAVKLVFILREPAARAYSNYRWSVMNGLETEDFASALALERKRAKELPPHLRFSRPFDYFARGLYASLLEPYFANFNREQILCLKYEDIIVCPQALTAKLHMFLGVEPRPDDAQELGIVNDARGAGVNEVAEEIFKKLRAAYDKPNRKLAELLGPSFEIWSRAGDCRSLPRSFG